MAYQPVPELPDDTAENVPRVMGVRADDSLALAPAGLPLTGGTLTGDLQVGGTITAAKAGNQAVVQSDYFRAWVGSLATPAFSFAGYPHLGIYLSDGAGTGMIAVTSSLHVHGTIYGTLAFNVADGIDTADVLDRAETATMPVVDDEGVATTDAETVTVNEVMTALLAKVKQLSAEIEELKKGA